MTLSKKRYTFKPISEYQFATDLAVHISHINYGQHVGNDSILALAHEARCRWLHSLGLSEVDIGNGCGTIMTEAHIQYVRQSRWQDILRCYLLVPEVKGIRYDVHCRMVNSKTGEDIAHVIAGIACFDYKENRLIKVPASFADTLHNLPKSTLST